MYYTKRPFLLGEPPYDSGGGSAPAAPGSSSPSYFNAFYTPPTARPAPAYPSNYANFLPPSSVSAPTVRPPLAPAPTVARPPVPQAAPTYIYNPPTGVAVSQKPKPPPATPAPTASTTASVPANYAPTDTQTNAPIYTGSTATHAEGGGYKGPTPVFAAWSPGSATPKQSAKDRRKSNQVRAEQNKKAREQAAKAARERLNKEQRKRADEYNKQQKKAAEAEKRQAEQYFKQMEAQEKALMKDREAQVKAQREAAKQREVIAKQEAQLAAQRAQVEQQRRAQQEQQRQAAEKLAQTTTPTDYPYDTSANRYPETGLPPDVKTAQARGLQAVYFTKDDIAKTRAPWGGYTSSSGDRIVKEIIRRGEILKKGEPKLLTEKRKAELNDLLARRDYLTPEEQARLSQLKSFMTPDQKMIMDAALGAPRKELENMATTILKKFGTATSPSAGGLITPESTEAEQSAAYEQRATEFASTWNQQFNEMVERVDLLKRLEEEKSLVGKNEALRQLKSKLSEDEYRQLSKGLVREGAREAKEYADTLTTKEQPSVVESLFKAVFATPAAKEKAVEAANVRDLGPDYRQWIVQQPAQVAPVTPLPPEGWIADPRYAEQQALQQKFDYPVFGDNLTTLETAVAPMTPRPSVADESAAAIAEIQKQISANDQQVAEARQRLNEPIEVYQPFKFKLLDTEEAVARESMQPVSAQPSTPMTVLDKVPARSQPSPTDSYGITDLISDTRSTVSATKMYSSPTSLLDVKNIGPGVIDLDRVKSYTPEPKAQPVSFGLLRGPKVPEINQRTAVPIDYMMRSAKTVISPFAKELASSMVPQEYQKEAFDAVDAVTTWGSKMATDTQAGDTARAYLHRYAFERGPIAETVGAAAQRVGGSLVNVAQKIPGLTTVSPYATKTIRFLASQPVSVAGAVASGVVDYGKTVQAVRENWQAERDLEYQKQDYEQLRNERINTMTREEARLADRKKVLDYRIGEYDRWIRSGEFYQEGAWGREKLGRALDKIASMKEQLKLVDEALQNISQDRLKDAQQYQARGLQPQEAARRQAEAEAAEIERLTQSMQYTGI